ncbi:MAG: hypothetical protein ACTSV3_07730 [Candidatus Thorarchaeota archaeon]|nr:MAG: hypothetical protein DRP09_07290 [Candidatus Thorarchaeota archaeon]RLI60293.1 MAG: hypothetical protein DRO87_00320 [Candidatus Thorarchaeota archaeon]
MRAIEAKIRSALEEKGIKCQAVYQMPDPEDVRVLLAFNSRDNKRISTNRVEKILNSLDVGPVKVPRDFQRLSSAFLHLEVTLGARTERNVDHVAM